MILLAAEELLIEGGPRAVEIRAVAIRVNMTDAGIAHHFDNHQGLMLELLRHGGKRLRAAVGAATTAWIDEGASVPQLVEAIASVYADGYGELAIALHAAGWRDDGIGLLEPVVDALHAARTPTSGRRLRRADTRLAVAALHQAIATDPSYGAAFRRSAGITRADDAAAQRKWWSTTLCAVLGIGSASAPDR